MVVLDGKLVETVYLGTTTQYIVELTPGARIGALEQNLARARAEERWDQGGPAARGVEAGALPGLALAPARVSLLDGLSAVAARRALTAAMSGGLHRRRQSRGDRGGPAPRDRQQSRPADAALACDLAVAGGGPQLEHIVGALWAAMGTQSAPSAVRVHEGPQPWAKADTESPLKGDGAAPATVAPRKPRPAAAGRGSRRAAARAPAGSPSNPSPACGGRAPRRQACRPARRPPPGEGPRSGRSGSSQVQVAGLRLRRYLVVAHVARVDHDRVAVGDRQRGLVAGVPRAVDAVPRRRHRCPSTYTGASRPGKMSGRPSLTRSG